MSGGRVVRFFRSATAALVVSLLVAAPELTGAEDAKINIDADNVAIRGYDSVAYFTLGEATKGRPEYTYEWQDAQWHFVNAAHRDLFAAGPAQYAPQFGGFCADAMTRGVKARADPENWTIVDGKLYMYVTKEARDSWQENSAENIEQANERWSRLEEES